VPAPICALSLHRLTGNADTESLTLAAAANGCSKATIRESPLRVLGRVLSDVEMTDTAMV